MGLTDNTLAVRSRFHRSSGALHELVVFAMQRQLCVSFCFLSAFAVFNETLTFSLHRHTNSIQTEDDDAMLPLVVLYSPIKRTHASVRTSAVTEGIFTHLDSPKLDQVNMYHSQ